MEKKDIIRFFFYIFVYFCIFGFLMYKKIKNIKDGKINIYSKKINYVRSITVILISLLPALIYFVLPSNLNIVIKNYSILILSLAISIGLLCYLLKNRRFKGSDFFTD